MSTQNTGGGAMQLPDMIQRDAPLVERAMAAYGAGAPFIDPGDGPSVQERFEAARLVAEGTAPLADVAHPPGCSLADLAVDLAAVRSGLVGTQSGMAPEAAARRVVDPIGQLFSGPSASEADVDAAAVRKAGNLLQAVCFRASYSAGWWDTSAVSGGQVDLVGQRGLFGLAIAGQKIALVHSEVSEALEGVREDSQDKHLPHRKSVEVELADAVIRICDLAGAMGLDLGGAIAEKMAYNAQRADHKRAARNATGGKAF